MGFFLLVCWILSMAGLSAPGRPAPLSVQTLDPIALVKLATRAGAVLVLIPILLRSDQTNRSRLLWRRLFPLILFAAWTVVSVCWSALPAVTLGHAIDVVLLVMLSGTAGLICTDEENYKRVFCHLTVIAMVMSIVLIILNFRTIAAGQRPIEYMQPNDMAKTAGAGLMLFTCCRVLWRWKWTGKLFVPAVGILSFLVFAARSRTASILTPLVLLVICWRLRNSQAVLVVCAFCGLLAAVIAVQPGRAERLSESVVTYMARGQNTEQLVGMNGRTEMWTIAIKSFENSPLFGHGYYTMSDTGFLRVWGKVRWQTAHNAFLHVLTGLGLLGLLFFLYGLFSTIQPSLVALKDRGRIRKVEFLALVIVVWYCAMGLFELSFFGPVDTAVVIFYVLVGISAGSGRYHGLYVTGSRPGVVLYRGALPH